MMLDFIEIKSHEDNGMLRKYYGSSYQGGMLLKTTTMYLQSGSIAEAIIDLPMCEMYKKEDGSMDVRRMNFVMTQSAVDLGFDIPQIPEEDYPEEVTKEQLK